MARAIFSVKSKRSGDSFDSVLDVRTQHRAIVKSIKLHTDIGRTNAERNTDVVTGELRDSYVSDFSNGGLQSDTYNTAPYANYYFLGTINQEAKPVLQAAMRNAHAKLTEDFGKIVRGKMVDK